MSRSSFAVPHVRRAVFAAMILAITGLAFTALATGSQDQLSGPWVFQYPPFAGGNDWDTTGYLLNTQTGALFLVEDEKMTRVVEEQPKTPTR